MVYPYTVKFKGMIYKAGVDVPESVEKKVENVVMAEVETSLPDTTETAKSYSKTDINRMPAAELKALAESVGIENAEDTSGNQLKKKLIEYYGL